ncbi:MAG: HupE/UreJ family protein, partial [Bacteroidia bacterium]
SFLLSSLLGPGKGIIFPLFSFNLGLEIGQLLIVAALILIAQLWQMLLPKKEKIRVQLFSIMGAVFSFWLMYTRFLNLYNS